MIRYLLRWMYTSILKAFEIKPRVLVNVPKKLYFFGIFLLVFLVFAL